MLYILLYTYCRLLRSYSFCPLYEQYQSSIFVCRTGDKTLPSMKCFMLETSRQHSPVPKEKKRNKLLKHEVQEGYRRGKNRLSGVLLFSRIPHKIRLCSTFIRRYTVCKLPCIIYPYAFLKVVLRSACSHLYGYHSSLPPVRKRNICLML